MLSIANEVDSLIFSLHNMYFPSRSWPIQYISRFIAKLTFTCEPIFKLLKKNESHTWNDKCQKVFELIKEYLLTPILVPPQHERPLLLYLSIIGDAVGSMLAREDDDKNERTIYYLSSGSKNGPIEVSLWETCFEWKIVMIIDLVGKIWFEVYG